MVDTKDSLPDLLVFLADNISDKAVLSTLASTRNNSLLKLELARFYQPRFETESP